MADMETPLSTVLEQVSKRILDKLEKGKKLTTEDILLLYLDMTHRETHELRRELREMERSLRDEIRRLEERIDGLSKRLDATNRRIDTLYQDLIAKIEDTNRRIDRLYELLTGTSGKR